MYIVIAYRMYHCSETIGIYTTEEEAIYCANVISMDDMYNYDCVDIEIFNREDLYVK